MAFYFRKLLPSPLTSFVLVSLTSLFLLTHAASIPPNPPDLTSTVRSYLENGGHEEMQKLFNLSKHVYYDPLMFLTRENAYRRLNGKIVPPQNAGTHSDLQLLRAMGLHVPGVDSATVRSAGQSSQCANSSVPPTRMTGSKSTIDITYSPNTPSSVKIPVQFAVGKWTDEFESTPGVNIRICFAWGGLDGEADGEQTLGTTNTCYFTYGKDHRQLRDDAVYNAALASSLIGEDMISQDQFHVHMLLNSRIAWHLDTNSRAPNNRYDLATTVLHELTHGLFFSGTIEVPNEKQTASYMHRAPGRFDAFLNVENDIGVVRGCTGETNLYNAVTSPYLRFRDAATGANFGLYAPWPFAKGSSIYHFNNTQSLNRECDALGIDRRDCSDLMTHELVDEYTQRSLGETTLRVYRAMRSEAAGPPAGRICNLTDNSGRLSQAAGPIEPFSLPLWVIVTVAALGGTGAILVFGVIISSITKGSNT